MKLIEAQFMMFLARAHRQHAEIVSGAYKMRKTQRGDSSNPSGWRDLTDDEKLKESLQNYGSAFATCPRVRRLYRRTHER